MKKVKKLEWNVLNYDWNSKKVYEMNVLHIDALDNFLKRSKPSTFEEYKEIITSYLRYYYMSRREYEIAVSDLSNYEGKEETKVSAYDQAIMNIDRITEYVMKELAK